MFPNAHSAGARAWLLAGAAFAVAVPASGNGRYPAADLVVFSPEDDQHLFVRATFGMLESLDGGRSFGFVCEEVLGLRYEEDPMLAIAGDGSRVAATFDGFLRSEDGCDWQLVTAYVGRFVADLSLDRSAPNRLIGLTLIANGDGTFESELVRSLDHGASFESHGEPLPAELLPITLDIAPSDSERVYVTARTGHALDYSGVLLRSVDGGLSFEQLPIPGTQNARLAFIAAVHPTDPDQLYVRLDTPTGTNLVASSNGGDSFETLLTGTGELPAFAVSKDGLTLYTGGPDDGVFSGDARGGTLERISDFAPTCLGSSTFGLVACTQNLEGFGLALSEDGGETFEPLLSFADLDGTSSCPGESQVKTQCPGAFEELAPRLGAQPATAAGAAGSAGAAGQPALGGEGGDAGADGAEGNATPGDPEASGGCGLRPAAKGTSSALLLGSLVCWWLYRRRREARS